MSNLKDALKNYSEIEPQSTIYFVENSKNPLNRTPYKVNIALDTWIQFIHQYDNKPYNITGVREWLECYVMPWHNIILNLYRDLRQFQADIENHFKNVLHSLGLNSNKDFLHNWIQKGNIESLNNFLHTMLPHIVEEWENIIKKNFCYKEFNIDNNDLLHALYDMFSDYYNIKATTMFYYDTFMSRGFYKVHDLSEDYTDMFICTPYISGYSNSIFTQFDFFNHGTDDFLKKFLYNPITIQSMTEIEKTELDNLIQFVYQIIYKAFRKNALSWISPVLDLKLPNTGDRDYIKEHDIIDSENYIQFIPLSADNLPYGFVIKDTEL